MANIIRVDHTRENPYLQVCRKTIRDKELDLQAKGLLLYVLAKPDDWRIRATALAGELQISRETVIRIVNRLIKYGYVHREIIKRRAPDGKYQTGAIYTIFEDKEYRREWLDRRRFKPVSDDDDVPF